jgi:hypothetical protein
MRLQEEVASLVGGQMDLIRDPEMSAALAPYLVSPALQFRRWDYSDPPGEFACWMVAIFPSVALASSTATRGMGRMSPGHWLIWTTRLSGWIPSGS